MGSGAKMGLWGPLGTCFFNLSIYTTFVKNFFNFLKYKNRKNINTILNINKRLKKQVPKGPQSPILAPV